MRVLIGVLILAGSTSAMAAGQGIPDANVQSYLMLMLMVSGLVVVIFTARWLYNWNLCRKATCAATRAVKERVARGHKPYY
ncbi:exported hypothetical protein [Pseudomonas veronii]|uniref:hypothetical protein n=1 Tax=Pseudomonas veronii TaxID=76761 RepID=UPI00174F9A8F|nr:hypothetical protein [Pseudomonas veronii]CAD0264203.1 exported hypothetical protein [Pseudomonas veronii]